MLYRIIFISLLLISSVLSAPLRDFSPHKRHKRCVAAANNCCCQPSCPAPASDCCPAPTPAPAPACEDPCAPQDPCAKAEKASAEEEEETTYKYGYDCSTIHLDAQWLGAIACCGMDLCG